MPRGRAIWSGSISFGLVNVPVKLHSAVQSKDVHFNQLERDTGSRIRYRKVSEATGDEIESGQIVKGYDLGGGQYVTVEDDELKKMNPKATQTVEIEEFVDLADVDPLYFVQPYYLMPDKQGAKAYKLLLDVMEKDGRVAIGRLVMRSKEYMVAIRPLDGVLCIETLRFADEIVDAKELAGELEDAPDPSAKELKMAQQLVESLVAEWEPEKYHDSYREQVLELIDKKAAGEEIVAAASAEPSAKVVDLMAALEASLKSSGKRGSKDGDAESEAAAAAEPAPKSRKKAASG